MQRESPTDATVTTHPSIITKVTVVPDFCPVNVKVAIYKSHACNSKELKIIRKKLILYGQKTNYKVIVWSPLIYKSINQ